MSGVVDSGSLNEEWERIKRVVEEAEKAAKVKADSEASAPTSAEASSSNAQAEAPQSGDPQEKPDEVDRVDPTASSGENPATYWMRFAQETVRSRVVLKKMPDTEAELVEVLKTSALASLHVSPGTTTIIKVWDEKLGSEASQAPHLRKAPHRAALFKRCMQAALTSTNGTPSKGELYLILDHGKATMAKSCAKVFEGVSVHSQHYELQLDEESLTARRGRLKVKSPLIRQTEKLFVYTGDKKYIPDNKRKNYPGTNRGQQWGFIVLPPVSQTWRLKADEKKRALGEDAIRPVGGKAEDASEDDLSEEEADAQQRERDTDLVPFAYHSLPKEFTESVVHSFGARGVIDFTPGDGMLAEAVLEAKDVMYLGFCHTEEHCDMLRRRLAEQVMAAMLKDGNPLMNVLCMQELKHGKADAATTAPEAGAKAKSKPKQKRSDDTKKSKKTKKAKKSAKSSSSSASSSSSPAGASDDD